MICTNSSNSSMNKMNWKFIWIVNEQNEQLFIEFISEQNEQKIQKYKICIDKNSKFFMNFVFNSINQFNFNYFYSLF